MSKWVIYKELMSTDEREFERRMNHPFIPLKLDLQRNEPVLWFACDPEGKQKNIKFRWLCTGEEFEQESIHYLGSIQTGNGLFVLHLIQEETDA